MKVLICGSRDYNNWNDFRTTCQTIFAKLQYEYGLSRNDFEIISGGAGGADTMAEKFSLEELNKKAIVVEPNWDEIDPEKVPGKKVNIKINTLGKPYNSLAGFIRNHIMVDMLNPEQDVVIAFWKNKSKGTKDTMDYAEQVGIRTFIVEVK